MPRLLLAALAAFFMLAIGSAPAQVHGNLRVAVLLYVYSDDPDAAWARDYMESAFFGPGDFTVPDFYNKASWGQVQVTGAAFGWFRIPSPRSLCGKLTQTQNEVDAAATNSGVDLSQYDQVIYLTQRQPECNYIGQAVPGMNRNWVMVAAESYECLPGAPVETCQRKLYQRFVHEIGHSVGADHAAGLTCLDAAGNFVSLSLDCTASEYLDDWDAMGCCSGRMFSNFVRAELGWIPLALQVTLTSDTTVSVAPVANASSAIIRIPRGDGNYLVLENRALAVLPYDTPAGANGRLLIRVTPDYNTNPLDFDHLSYLVDGSPGDGPGRNDFNAAGLPVGNSVSDPLSGVVVTNLGFDGVNNTVSVDFPGGPPPPPPPPPPPVTQCADGIDNDGDSRVDFPADKQCVNAADNNEKKR